MATNKILFFSIEDHDRVNSKFVLGKLFAFECFREKIVESTIILNPAHQLIFSSNIKKSNCPASYSKRFLTLYNKSNISYKQSLFSGLLQVFKFVFEKCQQSEKK